MNQISYTNRFENKFVSLKEAMVDSGYSKDYIGQLCRSNKIEAKREKNSWVVNLESLLHYKRNTDSARREK